MANTTKRGNVGTTPFSDYNTLFGAVNTAQVFFPNSMVGLNASGFLDKLDDAAVKRFVGVVAGVNQEVLPGGSNGDVLIYTNQPRFITATLEGGGAAVAMLGRKVYAHDDQTVKLVPGAFGNLVGTIAYVLSPTAVVVEVEYPGHSEGNYPTQVLAVDGAIAIKSGVAYLTKATAGAYTLANPTAGVDDGKVVTILSVTAVAHTVTNPAGFNDGGASTDVATFGAAKGNNLVVTAYQGKWYVVTSVGITLA